MAAKHSKRQPTAESQPVSTPDVTVPPDKGLLTNGPRFAEPTSTADPKKFSVKHGSDKEAYSLLDQMKGKLRPRPFPEVAGVDEPVLELANAYGPKGATILDQIKGAKQLVFHALGDTGNTRGPIDQSLVADKMVADYDDTDPRQVPSFAYHLGDVVYSFGESMYYYDQFYEPYRDYPAPIFAIPGNHDGMVAPNSDAETLDAFRKNFCTAGESPHRTLEAGELSRTAQVQPGAYFTLESPFVRFSASTATAWKILGGSRRRAVRFPSLATRNSSSSRQRFSGSRRRNSSVPWFSPCTTRLTWRRSQ